jgi:cytochrome c oxidase subunit 2
MRWMPWLPVEASNFASSFDGLLLAVTAITALVAIGILIIVIVFSVRYRAGSNASRVRAAPEQLRRIQRRIEVVWITVPLAIFLAIGGGGAWLYFAHYQPPADAIPVYVVGKQWMWKLQHPNGIREINTLHVPRGKPVRLIMTSQDVIHSFFLPAFRIKQDVLPGRYTQLWFTATRSGDFHLFCAEYCGSAHSQMIGHVVVMEPAEFARWLQRGAPAQSMSEHGAQLFRAYGCSGCHGASATVHAPKLEGVFGRPVPLEGGAMVIADEAYLRDSILTPRKQVAAGYAPIMPSFAGRIDEDQLLDLIAYIRSLAQVEPPRS